MADRTPICFICKRSEESSTLKSLQDAYLNTLKCAADRRMVLKNDKYGDVTKEILNAVGTEGRFYHSQCLSQYSAVKRRSSVVTEQKEPPCKTTRSCSPLPPTDNRGVLGQQCVFCGKPRKKIKSQNEPLHLCVTKDGSRAIYLAAQKKTDTKILTLGEDLIAKNVKYHNSCRRDYLREEPAESGSPSSRKTHQEAFRRLSIYIEGEIIANKKPMLASALLNLYQEEYIIAGGTATEIQDYSVTSLLTKIKSRFPDILYDKHSKKSGMYVFSSSMTAGEASAIINYSDKKMEGIRSAAMALRAEILAKPSHKHPSPTSVHILKETAPSIPSLVMVFFDTLINGMHKKAEGNEESQMMDKRSIAMASDAMFNCTRGSLRPWKHQALGLGLGSLTGSKSVLTILNRLGHCISYAEVKRIETEIAFACSDDQRETPDGLNLRDDLATGNVGTYT